MITFIMCCGIRFVSILLRIFSISIHQTVACNFLFCWCLFLGLYQGDSSFIGVFGNVPSSSVFWKSLRRMDVHSSLDVWWNSPVKLPSPRLLFAVSCVVFTGSFYNYRSYFPSSDGSVQFLDSALQAIHF